MNIEEEEDRVFFSIEIEKVLNSIHVSGTGLELMPKFYLSHFTERDRMADPDSKYAWKGYDFDVLNKLDEKDYIRQGSHRSKSMYITKEGEAKAKELMEKYNVADW